jgi:flagellar secretion chaperone FliS
MSNYASHAYKSVGVSTTVEGASPHKLITMLYDGLLKHLRLAKAHMLKGELGNKAAALSKAMSILDQGLRASLDDEKGGDISARLRALYDYSERQLVLANARNDVSRVDEVIALIEPLRAAWVGIATQAGQPAPQGATR